MSDPPVYQQILGLLDATGASYRTLHHAPTRTSEEAASVRGESTRIGAKALLLKLDQTFSLFVISAALRLDSKLIRKHLGAKKSRFATSEELLALTGLVPGSVPPVGRPILPFDLYLAPVLTEEPRVAFNAGSLTDSVIVDTSTYLKVAHPTIFPFHKLD